MKRILLFLVFVSLPIYSYELPELGSDVDTVISDFEEKKINYQIMKQVYESNSVITDPEINDYLISLGNQLEPSNNINYFIVNDPSINAFAMLGSVIGVHSGLIFSSNTESELAGVIGHEIAHVTQKHLRRLISVQAKESYKTFLGIAIALLAARSNPQLASGAITAASASAAQTSLDYTRENEREADRVGLDIISKAGFDPKGFADFFNTINKFNEFSTGIAPAYLRTHPLTAERMSDIQDRIKDQKFFFRKNSIEFYLVKSKLKVINSDVKKIAEAFKANINNETYLSYVGELYGYVYSLIKLRNLDLARLNMDLIMKEGISSPMIIELNTNLLLAEGKIDEAKKSYQDALNIYPFYRSFIYGLARIYLSENNSHEAISFLKNYLKNMKDPYFYELLAKAYSKSENYILEHESLSDYFYYRYDFQEALTQMHLATKTVDGNFYEKSRVEYRLKELKREIDLLSD